jgi:putative metallohydrolase (TIGR04338 family)
MNPATASLYAAEDRVAASIGPRLIRWAQVEEFVAAALALDEVTETFPSLSDGVDVGRRSHRATASLAIWEDREMLIRDGSWNAVTVCHELAHLAAPFDAAHGPTFVATELELVRLCCGIEAAVELREAFVAAGVPIGTAGS